MNTLALKTACHDFVQIAAPYLQIKDADHYEETLALIESLMEDAADTEDAPMNSVIDLLAQSIETYENKDKALMDFEVKAMAQPADLAMLRLLMDHHNLSTADLPEIGSKSMVSSVLSGERQLNKKHIKALSDRFGIDPGLFF